MQFDVIASRLRTAYKVDVQIEPASYTATRWLADPDVKIPTLLAGSPVAPTH